MSVISAIKTYLANRANYGASRATSKIKYIVLHYTANDGDTDENNGKYFRNNVVKASAHYFVDDDSITQSVPDNFTAYHCGAKTYRHKSCRNANSIGIELCDCVKNGTIYPNAKTIENALDLTEYLMHKYNIPKANVIRHYDVTGKLCPAYWCGSTVKDALWKTAFWGKLGTERATANANKPATNTAASCKPYLVRVNTATLNVRNGAGTNYQVTTTVKNNGVYTIVDERNGWGKLKSGAGWVKLSYTVKL